MRDERQAFLGRFVARGHHRFLGCFDGQVRRTDDVPDLDRLRAVRGEVVDAGARRRFVLDEDEFLLGRQQQLLRDERREQRTGGGDVRRQRVIRESIGEPQRPRETADVEHRGHAGADVRLRVALRVCFQIRFDLVVGIFRADVEEIRAPVRPPRLCEMNVRVDESRRDEQAVPVDRGDALGDGARAGAIDLAVAEDDVRIRDRRAAAAVDECCSDDRARRRRRSRGRVDRAGDADAPTLRRLHEHALRDPSVLLRDVANAVAIRRVHDAVRDAHEM